MKNEILEQLVLEALSYDILKEARKKKSEKVETSEEKSEQNPEEQTVEQSSNPSDDVSIVDDRVKTIYDFLTLKNIVEPDFLREHEISVLKSMLFPMIQYNIESFFDGIYIRMVKKDNPAIIYSIIKDYNSMRKEEGKTSVSFNPATYATNGSFKIMRDGFFFSKTDPSVDIKKIIEEQFETSFVYGSAYEIIHKSHPEIEKAFDGNLERILGDFTFKRLKRKTQNPEAFEGKALVITGADKKCIVVITDSSRILTKTKKPIYDNPEDGLFITIFPQGVFKYVNNENKLVTIKIDMSSSKTSDFIKFDAQDIKSKSEDGRSNLVSQQNLTTLSTEVMSVIQEKFGGQAIAFINNLISPTEQMKLASIQMDKTVFSKTEAFKVPNGGVCVVVKKPDTFAGSYVVFVCTKDSEFKTFGSVNAKINTRRFFAGILYDEDSSVSVKDFATNMVIMTVPFGGNTDQAKLDIPEQPKKEPQYRSDDKPEDSEPSDTQKSAIIRDFERQFLPDDPY